MPATVIGVFEPDAVREVSQALAEADVRDDDLDMIEGDERAIVAAVRKRGYDEDDARTYARAAQEGLQVVAVSVPETRIDQIVELMQRFEADFDEEGQTEAEERVPVVEEELETHKRKVARGGVRATSRVEERPVETTVNLREEHVEADRRRVDRPLRPEEAGTAFKNRTVEMTETAEELEVGKEARVVEEVRLTKNAEEHEEKVRDTVRRTKVDVERIEPSRRK
ncbi:MAG: YsnF/AvaK domain-containing protein [Geminicoccaceae bacterium]